VSSTLSAFPFVSQFPLSPYPDTFSACEERNHDPFAASKHVASLGKLRFFRASTLKAALERSLCVTILDRDTSPITPATF
jgi:hypothetical protein